MALMHQEALPLAALRQSGLCGMQRPHLERNQRICQGNQPTNHATVADRSVEGAAPELTRAAIAVGADVGSKATVEWTAAMNR